MVLLSIISRLDNVLEYLFCRLLCINYYSGCLYDKDIPYCQFERTTVGYGCTLFTWLGYAYRYPSEQALNVRVYMVHHMNVLCPLLQMRL